MKSRYIKFFKKELVFLLVLLIVVCISFGITYANFIYNSEGKRAVEMFAGALSYNIKINGEYKNNIDLIPGSQIVNIDIESLIDIVILKLSFFHSYFNSALYWTFMTVCAIKAKEISRTIYMWF